MVILVTGAAGYIGSVIVEILINKGISVISIDNLKNGHKKAIHPEAIFYKVDLLNKSGLEQIFKKNKIDTVIHLAAKSIVTESMVDPKSYFENNVIGTWNLLNIMLKNNVTNIIFSSTASVYGEPDKVPIDESVTTNPTNFYGESKLICEKIIQWYSSAYNLKYIILRYFNVAGATVKYGEDHRPETHLIPNVLKVALGYKEFLPVYGTDYSTKDGSCIRDFIHVLDIANAHILAIDKLINDTGNKIINLGTGIGFSVLEIVKTVETITNKRIPLSILPRRDGDPAILVASNYLANQQLGWSPANSSLNKIIESAWLWIKNNPNGYAE